MDKSQARKDLDKMNEEIADLQAKRQRVLDLETDTAIGPILGRFKKDIEEQKEALVEAEKKDFDKLQARIFACRQLACTLKGAYQAELEEKIRQRAEFEKHNALLLMAAEPAAKKGKKDKGNEVANAQSAAS